MKTPDGLTILIVLGVLGAVLLAAGHALASQMVWLAVNAGLVRHNWKIGQRRQAALFIAYLFLCVWGVWTWAHKGEI